MLRNWWRTPLRRLLSPRGPALHVERLETREVPATNITIIPGASGTGDQDAAFIAGSGTLSFTALDTAKNTLSLGAINTITGSAVVQALGTITISDLSGGATVSANGLTLSTDILLGTSIGFAKSTDTLTLSKGKLTFDAKTAINASTLVASAGDITLRSVNALALTAPVTASGTVRLSSDNGVSQSAAATLSASTLGVRGGTGAIALSEKNSVGTVAASTDGDVRFQSTVALTVDSVTADAALFTATSGITSNKGLVALLSGGNLSLTSSVSATNQVVLKGAGTVGGSGTVTTANGLVAIAGSSFSLPNAHVNLFAGSVTGASPGASDVTSNQTLSVGSVSGDGTLVTATTKGITTAGSVAVTAALANATLTVNDPINATAGVNLSTDSIAIKAAINATGGEIRIAPYSTGVDVTLGAAAASGLVIDATELANLTASTIRVGDTTKAASVNVAGAIAPAATTLVLQASGIVAGTGAITVSKLAATGGNVTLSATNAVSTVALNATTGKIQFNNGTNDLTVGSVDTLTGAVASADDVSITAGGLTVALPVTGGKAVTLSASKAFSQSTGATISGRSVSISAVTAALAGDIPSTGGVTVTASTGAISQTAGTIGGTAVTLKAGDSISLAGTGLSSTGSVSITATNGKVAQSAGAVIKGGDVLVRGNTAVTLADSVTATGGVTVQATAGALVQTAGTISSGKDAVLTAGQDAKLGGTVTSAGAATVTATAGVTVSGSVSATGNVSITAGTSFDLQAGAALAGGSVSVQAGGASALAASVTATSGDVLIQTTAGPLAQTAGTVSGQAVSLIAADSLGLNGAGVTATKGTVLTSTKAFSQATGAVVSGGSASISGSSVTLRANVIGSTGGVTATTTGGSLVQTAGIISGSSARINSVGDSISLGGGVSVTGNANITAGTSFTQLAGATISGGSVTISGTSVTLADNVTATTFAGIQASAATGVLTQTGGTVTAPAVNLSAGDSISLGGKGVSATGIVNITVTKTAVVQNAGATVSGGTVLIQGNTSVGLADSVTATGSVTVQATAASGVLTQTGGTVSGTAVTLKAGDSISLAGTGLSSTGSVSITATNGKVAQSAGAVIKGGDVLVRGNTAVTLADSVTATGGVTVQATAGALVQTAGTISSGKDAVLTAGQDAKLGGTVTSAGAATVTATAGVTVSGSVSATGNVSITAGTSFDLQAGAALAGGSVSVQAGGASALAASVTATSGDVLIQTTAGPLAQTAGTVSGQAVSLIAADSLGLNGLGISAAKAATLTASKAFSQAVGAVVSGGSASITGSSVTLRANVIGSTGGVVVSATGGSLVQTAGVVSGSSAKLTSTGDSISLGGGVSVTGNASIAAGTSFTQLAGATISGGNVTITGTSVTLADNVAAPTGNASIQATSGAIVQSGGAVAGQNVTLLASTSISLEGKGVSATGNVNITATNNEISQEAGAAISGVLVLVQGNTDVTLADSVTATGSVTVQATTGSLTQTGGTVSGSKGVLLTAGKDANLGGSVTSSAGIQVTAGNDALLSGSVSATGNVTIQATAGSLTQTAGLITGAAISLTAAKTLTIGGNVNTTGTATLKTTTNDLQVKSGATVTAGTLSIAAQTDAVLGGTVSSTGNTTVTAQTGAIQVVGGSLSAGGSLVLNAGTSISLSGSVNATSTASLTAGGGITQTASGPIIAPALSITAGSKVALDVANNDADTLTVSAPGQPVAFRDIDGLTVTNINAGSVTLILGGALTVQAPNSDNTITFTRGPSDNFRYQFTGGPVVQYSGVTSITYSGNNKNDIGIVDYVNGVPLPSGGLLFDGGSGSLDAVGVRGSGSQTAGYSPSATKQGDGTVTVDGLAITFTNLNPVDISGMALASLLLPNGNDVLTIDNGTDYTDGGVHQALRVSGTSGGAGIETVAFYNNATLLIDTDSVTPGAADTITVASADKAHGNANVLLRTGTGANDSIAITGAVVVTGGFEAQSQKLSQAGNVTGGKFIELNSQTGFTQGGTLSADNLRLLGTGTFTVTAGDFDTIAADIVGPLNYSDTDGVIVGTVTTASGSTAGIATAGNSVSLTTAALQLLTVEEAITAGGTVTLNADQLLIDNTVNATATGRVNLLPVSGGRLVTLGGADVPATTLGITNTEFGFITANVVQVGRANTQKISLDTNITITKFNTLSLLTDADVVQGNPATLTVGRLAIQSKLGVGDTAPLTTAVGQLAVSNTGSGQVRVSNTGDLLLVATDTVGVVNNAANSLLSISTTGKLTAGVNVTSGGSVRLAGQTGVTVNAGLLVQSNTGDAVLTTINGDIILGTGVSVSASSGSIALVTSATGAVSLPLAFLTAKSTVNITASSTVTLGTITSSNGPVSINSSAANIVNGGGTTNVASPNVTFSALTGVGVGKAITTNVASLEATTATGGIFITNAKSLAIGGVTGTLGGVDVTTSGDVSITAQGNLSVQNATDNVTTASGNVTLVALAGDLQTGGSNAASIVATGGTATLNASNDVLLGDGTGQGSLSANVVNATGGRDVIVTAGTAVDAPGKITFTATRDIAVTQGGGTPRVRSAATSGIGVYFNAGRNVTIDAGASATDSDVSTAGADIVLSAGTGSITLTSGRVRATNDDVNFGNMALIAATGIVQTGAVITAAGLGAKNTTTGDIILDNPANRFTVVAASNPNGDIDLSSSVGFTIGTVTIPPLFTLTGIDAGNNMVCLEAVGGVSQTTGASITANMLGVRNSGSGDVLLNLANNVNVLGIENTAANGRVTFNNNKSLVIDSVPCTPAVVGVTSKGGDILIVAAGSLQLNQQVNAKVGSATPATVRIAITSGVAQVAAGKIAADSLGVTNSTTGDIALSQVNSVSTFAAANGATVGSIGLNSDQALTIGSVSAASDAPASFVATSGITTSNGAAAVLTTGTLAVNTPVSVGTANATLLSDGAMTLASTIAAGTVRLRTTAGSINQTAGTINANALAARTETSGNIILGQVNNVATFAAKTTANGDRVSLRTSGPLALGSVAGLAAAPFAFTATSGVTTDGDVLLHTGGTLNIAQPLATGSGTSRLHIPTGDLAQSAAITGGGLGIRLDSPTGKVNLPLTNNVALLAVAPLGPGIGLAFTNAGPLTIGTVTSASDGAASFAQVDGITTSDQTITLTAGGLLTIAKNITAGTASIALNSAGANELPGVTITGSRLQLLGVGNFNLNQANVVPVLLANVTGSISFRTTPSLSIDPAGVLTNGGNVTLTTAANFTASASPPATVLFDLGAGALTVNAGANSPPGSAIQVTLGAEIKASSATFGVPVFNDPDSSLGNDSFTIRPSQFTPIFINGNKPAYPPYGTDGPPDGDSLSLSLSDLPAGTGIDLQNPGNPYNGTIKFSGGARRDIIFTSIETLGGVVYEAYAYQTGPGVSQYDIVVRGNISGAPLVVNIPPIRFSDNPFVVTPALQNPIGAVNAPELTFARLSSSQPYDLVIAGGSGSAPLITIVNVDKLRTANLAANAPASALVPFLTAQFYAYSPDWRGGVNVAAGDLDGDGRDEVITGAGAGGGPHVRVFSYNPTGGDRFNVMPSFSNPTLASFYAYSATFAGGVQVAAGDVDGDGKADIITAAGPGGGPHIEVFRGTDGAIVRSYYAYNPAFTGGVMVAAADYDGDGKADILTAPLSGGSSHIRMFRSTYNGQVAIQEIDANPYGNTASILANFLAFPPLTNKRFPGDANNSLFPTAGGSLFPNDANGLPSVGSIGFFSFNGDNIPDIQVGTGSGFRDRALMYRGDYLTLVPDIFQSVMVGDNIDPLRIDQPTFTLGVRVAGGVRRGL